MVEILQNAYEVRSKKLNKIEKLKQLKSPEEAYIKLKQYANEGFDAIPEEDKSYFLKCFGIYYRPATPKKFMLKLRIPGGFMSASQAKVIGECAKEFGQDYIDLTTRQQCELRYLSIEDLPTIIKCLEDVGINAYQTGVDNIRGIVADPFDDLAFDNIIPSRQTLLKLQDKFLKNSEWISTLPRKFNTSITGNLSNRCNAYGNDCCFVLAQKDGVFGYNLYLGGRVGMIAKDADIFLKDEEEVLAAFSSITDLFKRFGFRDNRNKNRLHFLIDAVGIDVMSQAIRENAGIDFATSGETMTKMDYVEPDHGKVQLRDGSFGVHVVVPSGVFKGTAMIELSELATKYGNSELRFDIEQSCYIMGVKDVDALVSENFFQTYKNINTPYFNHLIACAGTEHCPFGVIENKNDAIEMATYLSQNVPLDNARVRMYWSACVKGCGIHGLGDVGFEGCKAKIEGENVSGVHILLGGKLLGNSQEGRSVIKSAPLSYARLYVESLMLEYKKLRKKDESFESFYERILTQYSFAYIGFLMMFQAYVKENNLKVDIGFDTKVTTGKIEEFELFVFGRKLYYQLSKEEPYSAYKNFSNFNKREKPTPLQKLVPTVDENFVKITEAALHHDEEKRALVFSELLEFILLYKK